MAGPTDEDENPSPADDAELDAEEAPRAPAGRRRAAPGRRGVRRWQSSDEFAHELDGDEEYVAPKEPGTPAGPRERRRVFWRARDSLYFEPLVALAIIVVLLVSLFAYTNNWPPVYVIESNSMQHGAGDHLGVLNAGDVVLAQRLSNGSIVPYVAGVGNGYSTYGEPGDVVLYHPNGSTSATPIIHRAILFLTYNATQGSYSAFGLNTSLSCGTGPGPSYETPGTSGNCAVTGLKSTLDLYNIGWTRRNYAIDISAGSLGKHSGYLTLGDNNSYTDQYRSGSLPPISSLVEPSWVVGVARGMLPWFGALKLLLDGNAPYVPSASWQLLGLTVVGVILAAFGVHWLLRRRGIESPLRRREEDGFFERDRETRRSRVATSRPAELTSWKEPDRIPEAPLPEDVAVEEPAPPPPSPVARRDERHRRRGPVRRRESRPPDEPAP